MIRPRCMNSTDSNNSLKYMDNRSHFKQIMQCLSNNDLDQARDICLKNKCRPKLGQLLVASGRLSGEDLRAMLTVHECTQMQSLPMGKLLVIAGCLSVDELRHYLSLNKMLRLPWDHHELWGQRLVEQGLLTQEQLSIAMNDYFSKGISLKEAIANRGWLSEDTLTG